MEPCVQSAPSSKMKSTLQVLAEHSVQQFLTLEHMSTILKDNNLHEHKKCFPKFIKSSRTYWITSAAIHHHNSILDQFNVCLSSGKNVHQALQVQMLWRVNKKIIVRVYTRSNSNRIPKHLNSTHQIEFAALCCISSFSIPHNWCTTEGNLCVCIFSMFVKGFP